MSIPIKTKEPLELYSGDTVKFTVAYSDFPASDGWELSYDIRGAADYGLSFGTEITADGDSFAVVIPATTSANWAAGDYGLFGFVTKGSERANVYANELKILPNQGSLSTAYEARSIAKQILDAHDTAYLNQRAGRTEQTVSFAAAGQTFTYENRTELLKAREYWANIYALEQAAKRRKQGKNDKRNILVRFQ